MPARPCSFSESNPHHIIIQSYNRVQLFYEDKDYRHFTGCLKKTVDRHGCSLHAYVLMSDHVQLLISALRYGSIGRAVELLQQSYTEHFNYFYRRVKRLLELDYSMVPVDAEQHLLAYHRYIELVPVRVCLVEHPADYPWSSYACNAMGEDVGLIEPHPLYSQLGADEQARRNRYRALFEETRMQQATRAAAPAAGFTRPANRSL